MLPIKIPTLSPPRSPSRLQALGLIFASVLTCLGVSLLINRLIGMEAPYLPFVAAVMLVAWYGGFWPGVLTTLLCGAIATYLYLPVGPEPSRSTFDRAFWWSLFSGIGIGLSWMCESLRHSCRLAEEQLDLLKHAEQSLRESNQRFRVAIEQAPIPIMLHAEDGEILAINRTWSEITGYSAEELRTVQDWVQRAYLPDQRAQVLETIQALYSLTQRCNEGEFVIQTRWANQERVWDFSSSSLGVLPDGRRLVISMAKDVTDRVHREAEVNRLTTAIEAAPNGIVITDPNGNIVWVNPAFSRMTGYTRSEAIGLNPRILKSGKQDDSFYDRLWTTIKAGQVWHGEVCNRRKDGSLYDEEMTIAPVRDSQGAVTHFIAIKQDVSERRQLEDQLRQAQKMEALGRLAGGVAHDFNNLLTVICGFSDLLGATLSTDDPRRESVKMIRDAGERATGLTRQLLAFSRRLSVQPVLLDFHTVVQETEKMLRRLIGEDVQLTMLLRAACARVRMDPGHLSQILLNLAVNARDAMPRGGQLRFETNNCQVDEIQMQNHPGVHPGSFLRLSVRDTGCGMTPEVKEHLFEPFFTTKEAGKGTGLGLATVHGIVQQAGGFIEVESAIGQGSQFHLYFPALCEEAVPDSTATAVSVPQGNETILLVEDDSVVRRMATASLEGNGYKVLGAGSGEEALRLVEGLQNGAIQLIATDIVMPGMDGREMVERLATQLPHVPVLFMTGYTDDSLFRRGVADSTHAFLQKPYTPLQLVRRVRELLDHRQP